MASKSHSPNRRVREKEKYERVISVVYHQTGSKMPPMARRSLITMLCNRMSGLDPASTKTKLQLAVKNRDLIEHNGHYCVTDDIERLRRAADAVANEVPVDQATLGEINRAIMALQEKS